MLHCISNFTESDNDVPTLDQGPSDVTISLSITNAGNSTAKFVQAQLLLPNDLSGTTFTYLGDMTSHTSNLATFKLDISSTPLSIQFQGLIPEAPSSFEFLAPGLIAMSVIIGGLSGLAMIFSREKELGTLNGLLMIPISRISIIFGKGFAQVVRGSISGILVFILSIILFGVHVYDNALLMALVLLLMIFLIGVLYPIIQLPWWLRIISSFLPLTYVVSAFRAVMVLDAPFFAISQQVYILSIFTIVVFMIAVPLFQRSASK